MHQKYLWQKKTIGKPMVFIFIFILA